MRRLGMLALCACSSSPVDAVDAVDAVTDADACAAAPPMFHYACVDGGIAGDVLDGTWTLTGLEVIKRYGGVPEETAITEPITLRRDGAGWCQFGLQFGTDSPELESNTYVDDNHVMSPPTRSFDSRRVSTYLICRRSSDGALYYRSETNGFAMSRQYTQTVEGVLTR